LDCPQIRKWNFYFIVGTLFMQRLDFERILGMWGSG
jgi:hypothetical protein